MFFYNVVVYCVLILFAKVVNANKVKTKPLKDNDDEDVKHTFAKLLKTIVKVNEERMQAMEKMTRLQDYMLTKNKLKTDDDDYDSMEEEDNRILLAFADLPLLLRRSEDETITRAMCNRFNLQKNNVHLWTSQFLKLACHSHAVGLCEHACKKSVRKLCDKFSCNLSTRRDLNTGCHENCSKYFEHDEEP